ncbi:hypothetical protein [Demequina globuliformis]|uniref:hypothetical protein n=1 Tax=Demequina globuliformis TaxID=676202 RepID=UPI00128D07F1|nr:hypothetical protein [Demequina globuliformis]
MTGVVAALVAAATLVWQIRAHRLGGRRVKVRSVYSIPIYGVEGDNPLRGDDQVAITVTNVGGMPVVVTGFGVRMGRSRHAHNMAVNIPHEISDRLPATAEPGGVPVQVAVPVVELRRAHDQGGVRYRDMRPWVRLGDGRKVFSRNPVPLA